jgi:outer membrane protein OmpA-like peptidoglycan-associated protein
MRKARQASLSAGLAVAVGVAAVTPLDPTGLTLSAQAQTAEEKKRREQQRPKAVPPRPQPQPQPRVTAPPPPPPPSAPLQKRLPPPEKPAKRFEQLPPPRVTTPPPPPPAKAPLQPLQKQLPPPEKPAKPFQKQLPPERPAQQLQKPPPIAKPPGPGPASPLTVTPAPKHGPAGPQGPAPKRVDDVKRFRLERSEEGGRRKVIEEPGKLFIVKEHNRTIVRHDEAERFRRRPGAKSERRADGSVETFYVRRDGVRIVTVVDAHGRLLRRYRRDRDGRERNIIDNRRFYRNVGIGVGLGVLGIIALNLPPPQVTIPYDEYIVDYEDASDDDLYETLIAPPIEDLDRAYSIEEIRDNYELRARVRSVDIDSINFDFGAWDVPADEYGKLERIARAILRVLRDNPEAVFLIAGYTDAVGSEEDNASLSQRRADAVAEVLTDVHGVPEENLVTQGYGEQYLKIDTQVPEPRNRRVSILNVTGLMAER